MMVVEELYQVIEKSMCYMIEGKVLQAATHIIEAGKLLDKVRRMEEQLNEIVSDARNADNVVQMVRATGCPVRLVE